MKTTIKKNAKVQGESSYTLSVDGRKRDTYDTLDEAQQAQADYCDGNDPSDERLEAFNRFTVDGLQSPCNKELADLLSLTYDSQPFKTPTVRQTADDPHTQLVVAFESLIKQAWHPRWDDASWRDGGTAHSECPQCRHLMKKTREAGHDLESIPRLNAIRSTCQSHRDSYTRHALAAIHFLKTECVDDLNEGVFDGSIYAMRLLARGTVFAFVVEAYLDGLGL